MTNDVTNDGDAAITAVWRGEVDDEELSRLHAEAFGHPRTADLWLERLRRHSLGWVTARRRGSLVGFVNVAWDGGAHAFLLDTAVVSAARRRGIGAGLVAVAVERAGAAGCEWLHVDCSPAVWPFYEACGFRPSAAGVIALASSAETSPETAPARTRAPETTTRHEELIRAHRGGVSD